MIPLDQLEPLIPPQPVDWWPPALGWWLLTGLPLLAWSLWRLRRHLPQQRHQTTEEAPLDPLRQAALAELASLSKPFGSTPAGPWLLAINSLLKRLCRARWPNSGSHTLSGRAWLAFLDSRCPAAGLTRWIILVEGGYHANCKLDDKAVDGLNTAIAIWIRRHA